MAHLQQQANRPHTQDHVLNSHNMSHNLFGLSWVDSVNLVPHANPFPLRNTRISCNNGNTVIFGGFFKGDSGLESKLLPASSGTSQRVDDEDIIGAEGRGGPGVGRGIAVMFALMGAMIWLARVKRD